MFRYDKTLTPQLFSNGPRDLVKVNSDAWLYIDLFEALDLREFSLEYRGQGEEGIHPMLMLRTIFYGLTHGVVTGRKLEEVCHFDNRFIVLSGNQKPSYRSFSRFLVRHDKRLKELFAQVVQLAQQMGLVSLGRVAIDGSRFKANSSRHKAMSYDRMQKAVVEITAELEKLKKDLGEENSQEQTVHNLPQEILLREKRLAKIQAAKKALEKEKGRALKGKDQKSFADHEALPMAKPKDGFMYGYNCQAAVDEKRQIIVAAEVHDSAADCGALNSMVEKVQENGGEFPGAVLADAGYKSVDNLKAIEDKKVEAYIAVGRGECVGERGHLESLTFEESSQSYRCLAGKIISIRSQRQEDSWSLQMSADHCSECPLISSCHLSSRQGKTFRVPIGKNLQLIIDHQVRMRSAKGREIYRRRKVIVEPVFGNIKNKGLKIFVRGKHRVDRWWKMVCTAHNLEKILRQWPSDKDGADRPLKIAHQISTFFNFILERTATLQKSNFLGLIDGFLTEKVMHRPAQCLCVPSS